MIRDINGIRTEFKTMENLVESVLEEEPKARSNDVYLYVLCCVALGADDLHDVIDLNLNMMTCHRVRRVIQNDQKILRPSKATQENRKNRKDDIEYYFTEINQGE